MESANAPDPSQHPDEPAEPRPPEATADRAGRLYDYRRRRFEARIEGSDEDGYEHRSNAYQRLVRELLEAERRRLIELRNAREISDEVRRKIERVLDYEASRLED